MIIIINNNNNNNNIYFFVISYHFPFPCSNIALAPKGMIGKGRGPLKSPPVWGGWCRPCINNITLPDNEINEHLCVSLIICPDARQYSLAVTIATIVANSLGTLSTFYSALNFHPPPPQTMLFFVRSTCGNGKILCAQQSPVSHRRNNIVLGRVGVRVRCKDEEVERTMVFHHIFVTVPRIFGNYCTNCRQLRGRGSNIR